MSAKAIVGRMESMWGRDLGRAPYSLRAMTHHATHRLQSAPFLLLCSQRP